jgi:acetyltransferase-like isoleucine patch superfamily enzyme
MKKEDRKKISMFMRGREKVLIIDYIGKRLNPTKYYHGLLSRNPFEFILKLIINGFCTILPASGFKNFFYRLLGMNIGKEVSISSGVIFDMGYPRLISIGDGAVIGTGVKILTHETTINNIRLGRVHIGKKALIGVRSIIRSGVTIGDKAIIGMGSFVNKDVLKKEFVGGVPASRVRLL